MPFVIATPPATTVELRTVRVLRFVINTGHEVITVRSLSTSADLSKQ